VDEAARRDLAGDVPLVTIDGWNVTTAARSFSKGGRSAIASNTAAVVDRGPVGSR
jgi:hypothetical protein